MPGGPPFPPPANPDNGSLATSPVVNAVPPGSDAEDGTLARRRPPSAPLSAGGRISASDVVACPTSLPPAVRAWAGAKAICRPTCSDRPSISSVAPLAGRRKLTLISGRAPLLELDLEQSQEFRRHGAACVSVDVSCRFTGNTSPTVPLASAVAAVTVQPG